MNEIQRLTFPGPKQNENFTRSAIMKPNEEKCLLSSQPTSLTFSLLSDWPEKCGKPLLATFFPLFFELFSSCFLVPPPSQVKTFFIKKIHIGKKASFHLIVKMEKNTKTQAIRALKEES